MDITDPEDDDVWHERHGVLRASDPAIQHYLSTHDELVAREKLQRNDQQFRQSTSSTFKKASAIVDRIRLHEKETLWTKDYEDSLAGTEADIYPGMMFSLAKNRIERSTLFKIVQKFPKGALLHCHFEAMVEFKFILEIAFELGDVYFKSSESLGTQEARETAIIGFAISETVPSPSSSIWDPDYSPGSLVSLKNTADSYPEGGRAGFISWMNSRCSITPCESIRHHDGPNQIWRKFLSAFSIIRTIIYHTPVFRRYVQRLCQQLHADGVEWADVRGVFFDPAFDLDNQRSLELIGIFGEEVEAFKCSDEGKGFWGMRIIWTWVRSFSKQSIIWAMEECIKIKKAYPQLIAGFDFVGQEERGRPLRDLIPEVFWFKQRCKDENLNIPFFFHAGETLGDGDETDNNLFDAVLLGSRRIGHGFSLFKHPLLIDMVKERNILIESCPVSNEVLRLTSSIMSHPLPALLARGVPASLSNDDPAILGQGSAGMSHDFWQALQGWENLGLVGLGLLAENSVRWAAFEDYTDDEWLQGINDGVNGTDIKAQRMQEWRQNLEKFCLWVVEEYGTVG